MVKKILSRLTLIAASLVLLGALGSPLPALAQSRDDVCAGVGSATGGTGCSGGSGSVNRVIQQAIFLFSVIVGIVAVVMVVMAGFKYITSGGDSSKTASAQSTLTYAIVGIIIVGLAQVIVRFVLDRAT